MKIKLSAASGEQVRKFASEVLGLDIKTADTIGSIRAKIATVWEGDEIDVEEGGKLAKVQVMPIETKDDDGSEMVRVIIQKTSGVGGSDTIFASVNGRAIWIPRGEPVDLAKKYFEVLQNAVEAIYDQLPDGGINTEPRMVPVYPYQRIA